MKARVTGPTVVRFLCGPTCPEEHEEEALFVSDANGWLYYLIAQPEPGGPGSRLLPTERVLSVDFHGSVMIGEANGEVVFERRFPFMSEAEADGVSEVQALTPEAFQDREVTHLAGGG